MKLPWDTKYLKISFHVIFTLIVVYALTVAVDGATYFIANFDIIVKAFGNLAGRFFSVFSSVFIGFVIAYLFDPAVDFLQKHYEAFRDGRLIPFLKKHKIYKKIRRKEEPHDLGRRTAGVIILYAILFSLLGILAMFTLSKFSVEAMGELVKRTKEEFEYTITSIGLQLKAWGVLDYVSDYFTGFVTQVTAFLSNAANNGVSALTSAGGNIVSFFIGLIIAFYFLRDKDLIIRKTSEVTDTLMPPKISALIKNFLDDIHAVFSGYIRGQLVDACIMSVLLGTFLLIIGVPFAPIIGLLSGISNLIPYFGAIIGFILAVTVALLSGRPMTALYAAIGVFILQQIDGIFIVPRVVGRNVQLSPVMVLISLSVAGALFGIPGMIFAVPIFAIIKIFLERFIQRRKKTYKRKLV